jgi:hypothetical protein
MLKYILLQGAPAREFTLSPPAAVPYKIHQRDDDTRRLSEPPSAALKNLISEEPGNSPTLFGFSLLFMSRRSRKRLW